MPSYRIEVSPNNRAGCKDGVCKKNGVKITKGEIRFGTWVEIEERGSWAWKHWGCISGAQLVNIQEAISADGGYDFDLIDGYDELNDFPEHQAKIRTAVEQGHIALEDFRGDPEKCKPGEKGIHLTAKQKEKKEAAAAAAESADEPPKKGKGKAQAKRGRAKDVDEEDEDEEDVKPKAKKARKAAKDVVDADEEDVKPKARKGRKAANHDTPSETTTKASTKPTRGRKAAAKAVTPPESEDGDLTEEVNEVEPEEEEEKPAPAKKGRRATTKKAKKAPEPEPEPEPEAEPEAGAEVDEPAAEEEPAPKAAATTKRGRGGRQSKGADEVKPSTPTAVPVRKSRRSSVRTPVEPAPEPEQEDAQEEQEEEKKAEPKTKGRRGRPRKSS